MAAYYANKDVGFYRRLYFKDFVKDLIQKKQLRVGIDYYALYGVCADIVPADVLRAKFEDLKKGKVFVYNVSIGNQRLIWEEIK